MYLDIIGSIFFLIFGLIVGSGKSVPMDFESVKDEMQMGVMAGAGMAMDLAEKAKIQGSFDGKIGMGPIQMEKKFSGGAGIMGNDDDSSEEDRRRKRRSTDNEKELVELIRPKRSPCFGRRRNQQAVTAAPGGGGGAGGNGANTAGGAGGAGAGGAGAGGAGGTGGAGGVEGNPDDLPRRRKRSPDYDEDVNENAIPFEKTIAQRTQEIGEKLRQFMKSILDVLTSTFENFKINIQNMPNSSDVQ